METAALARWVGQDGPGGSVSRLRQARGARAGADLPQFFLQQFGGGLGTVLSEKAASTQLVQKVTDRRSHRKGDLNGIDAVLLTGQNSIIMALVWHKYLIRQFRN